MESASELKREIMDSEDRLVDTMNEIGTLQELVKQAADRAGQQDKEIRDLKAKLSAAATRARRRSA